MARILQTLILIVFLLINTQTHSQTLTPLRVGVLKFGTVNWELNVIKHHRLDYQQGIDLQITYLGGKNATHVALQGGAVDVIVSDWIWVSRQRAKGRSYTFTPYSMAAGSLMLPPDSPVKSLQELTGQTLGIAGGPLDKTWLLLRAYQLKHANTDLTDQIIPKFAAPPLLNKLVQRGELDAVINFWHYAARLQAQGYRTLLDMNDVLKKLGITEKVPLVGWVFDQNWAEQNKHAITGLLQASNAAKKRLATSDVEWDRLRTLMHTKDERTFQALINGYRAGIPGCFGSAQIEAAKKTFQILASTGGRKLVGHSTTLNNGTFWYDTITKKCQP